MTIGALNEMHAKAGATAGGEDASLTEDDGSAKYGEPPVPILNDKLAYDEPYITDASLVGSGAFRSVPMTHRFTNTTIARVRQCMQTVRCQD
jgi:hypothetical protein